MSTCPTCGALLEGQWKFCLHCGAELAAAQSIEPEASVVETSADPEREPEPEPEDPDVHPIPGALRPEEIVGPPPISTLAVVALALGIVGGPVAAVFGHVAMRQIRQTGERGMTLARIATVLGYVWLVVWIGILVWVLVVGVR